MIIRFVPVDRYVLVDPGLNPVERRRNKARHEVGVWATSTSVIVAGYAAFFAGAFWLMGLALLFGTVEWWTSPAIVRTPRYMAWVHDLPGPETALAFALLRAREQVRVQLRVVRRRPEKMAHLFGTEAELADRLETINGHIYSLQEQ